MLSGISQTVKHPSIPKATFGDKLRHLRGVLTKYEVHGDSMEPVLKDGDKVYGEPVEEIHVGDIVVAKHPYEKEKRIVKRVADTRQNGSVYLEGIASHSTDSHSFGWVDASRVIARVVKRC